MQSESSPSLRRTGLALALLIALACFPAWAFSVWFWQTVEAAPRQPESLPAAVIAGFVVNSTNDPGVGVCDATECTLREAITAANAALGVETITFDIAGAGPHAIQLGGALPALAESVDIVNTSSESITVRRNTGGNYRVFTVNSGQTVNLSGLIITNGNTSTFGGGVLNSGTLTLVNITVTGNTAAVSGGGIFNSSSSTLTITNSTISSNISTGSGGGIVNEATLTITNSTISSNVANSGGGGIDSRGSTLTITNSTISNNSTSGNGGGIFNGTNATLTITNST